MVNYVERLVEPGRREPAPGSLRIVQLFVNSLNVEDGIELFDVPAVVSQWFIDKKLATVPVVDTGADLARVLQLREALRGLLVGNHDGAEPVAREVEIVESVAGAAGLGVTAWAAGGLGLTVGGSGLDAALGELLVIVVESSLSGQGGRLKACSNDGCQWAYWDGSRNHSSRWCSMALCGNQAKVRAHRQRRSSRA